MAGEIPTNTKKTTNPYKKEVFDAYVAWRSIPAVIRQGKLKGVALGLEQIDSDFGELLKLRNQTDFARKYGVENSTLTNWNKLIEEKNMLSETRRWASKLTSNVLFSLYKKTLENGSPRAVALWLQVVHGWNPKVELAGRQLPDNDLASIIKADLLRHESLKYKKHD